MGINHFLDTRTIKIEARNYVVVTPLKWQKKHPFLTCCDVQFSSGILTFIRTYWMIFGVCTMSHVGFSTLLFDVEGTSKEDTK